MSESDPSAQSSPAQAAIEQMLARPARQRLLEYKYRCAQALIFGLPVLGLQWFGSHLGGDPVQQLRWVSLLQALLAGWVAYVGAMGMLMEGLILLHAKVTADLIVAVVSVAMYLFSAIAVLGVFVIGRPLYGPLMFHWVVMVLALWCGWRWRRLTTVS